MFCDDFLLADSLTARTRPGLGFESSALLPLLPLLSTGLTRGVRPPASAVEPSPLLIAAVAALVGGYFSGVVDDAAAMAFTRSSSAFLRGLYGFFTAMLFAGLSFS